jgi:signal recognition particle subunit SEC65
MAEQRERLIIWPGYFDSKRSRRSGRRVPVEASVANPTLDGLAYAARSTGIKKMKRDEDASHPSRPRSKEGRLWVSIADALAATGASSKEGVLREIGVAWRGQKKGAKLQDKVAKASGPKTGDKRGRSQRKAFKSAKGRKPSERRKRRK